MKILIALILSTSAFAQTIYLPNIKSSLSGTTDAGQSAANVHVTGGSITATNPSVGPTGSANPAQATFIGADKSGILTAPTLDASSNLNVNVQTSALPAGAATSANQTNGTQQTQVTNFPATQSVTQGTSPWVTSGTSTVSGTVTVVQPTGTNLHAVVDSSALPAGAATNASLNTINTTLGSPMQNSGGSVTANAGINLNTSALNLESTQSAFKTANHTDLGTINTTLGSPFQSGGSIGNTTFGATQSGAWSTGRTWSLLNTTDSVSAVQSGTWNLGNISGTISLPTGASTSANQLLVQGSAFGGTAATNSQLAGGQYNSTPPTLANTQQSALQLDTNGNLKVTGSISASNPSVGVIGSTSPGSGTQIAGYNGGILRVIQENGSGALKVDGSSVTQPVSGSVSITGTSTVTANAGTGNFNVVQTAAASNFNVTAVQSAGTNLHTVVDSGTISLPTNAAQETGGNLATINTNTSHLPVALGSTTSANSLPVVIASDQGNVNTAMPDSYIIGQSAQTATVNNIITTTSGTAANDVSGYRSASIQIVSTGTAGTFIFEGSNDNLNFQTIPVYSQLVATGTPVIAAVTATASQLIYTFPINIRYVRLRIATTITGGSIQAFTRFSQAAWTPAVFQVANATAANLATTATIASGTVTTVSSVTSSNDAIPGIIADITSAALTTTTTTGTLTPTFGNSYIVQIPVTVVTGTTPTMQTTVQESNDSGTNWYNVYAFPTITTTGFYYSPPLEFKGNRVRYVQTVTGTTPSFTRAINRLQMSMSGTAAPVSNNATQSSSTVSTVSTISAPQNAVGFILQNLSTSTANIRFALGGAATTTVGIELLPGQDSGYIPAGSNVSIVAESGTQSYNIQWVQQ